MLVDSTIADCVASDSCGGGIWVDEANVTLQSGGVERCSAPRGGGMLVFDSDLALMGNSVIQECHAYNYGGGLCLAGCRQSRPPSHPRPVRRPNASSRQPLNPPRRAV